MVPGTSFRIATPFPSIPRSLVWLKYYPHPSLGVATSPLFGPCILCVFFWSETLETVVTGKGTHRWFSFLCFVLCDFLKEVPSSSRLSMSVALEKAVRLAGFLSVFVYGLSSDLPLFLFTRWMGRRPSCSRRVFFSLTLFERRMNRTANVG